MRAGEVEAGRLAGPRRLKGAGCPRDPKEERARRHVAGERRCHKPLPPQLCVCRGGGGRRRSGVTRAGPLCSPGFWGLSALQTTLQGSPSRCSDSRPPRLRGLGSLDILAPVLEPTLEYGKRWGWGEVLLREIRGDAWRSKRRKIPALRTSLLGLSTGQCTLGRRSKTVPCPRTPGAFSTPPLSREPGPGQNWF